MVKMVEIKSAQESTESNKARSILLPWELRAGFQVLREYCDEITTPVPFLAFVRKGWIIQASSMSKKHQTIQFQVTQLIKTWLLTHGITTPGDYVFTSFRLNVSPESAPKLRNEKLPDILVIPNPIKEDIGVIPQDHTPILIIEILSDSTEVNDLTEKKVKYSQKQVKYYWILAKADTPAEGLERSYFYELKGNKYVDISWEFQEKGVLIAKDCFGLEISAEDIWYKDDDRDVLLQLKKKEQQMNREKSRADQEKARADRLQKELDKRKSK